MKFLAIHLRKGSYHEEDTKAADKGQAEGQI